MLSSASRSSGSDTVVRCASRLISTGSGSTRWTVGVLKEFAPSLATGIVGVTQGCLLGYNKNMGEEIALRLRTGACKQGYMRPTVVTAVYYTRCRVQRVAP